MSKRYLAAVVPVFLGLASLQAQAASLEANINNESIQAEYEMALSGTPNLFLNAGALYSEEHSDSSTAVTVGISGVETDNLNYRAAVGARLYGVDAPASTTGAAVAFGGLFYHVLPGLSNVSAGVYGWYAPEITSFGDADRLYEIGGRIAYRVIANTDIFVGYRYLRLKSDKGFDDTLEDGVHVGFRLNF